MLLVDFLLTNSSAVLLENLALESLAGFAAIVMITGEIFNVTNCSAFAMRNVTISCRDIASCCAITVLPNCLISDSSVFSIASSKIVGSFTLSTGAAVLSHSAVSFAFTFLSGH